MRNEKAKSSRVVGQSFVVVEGLSSHGHGSPAQDDAHVDIIYVVATHLFLEQ